MSSLFDARRGEERRDASVARAAEELSSLVVESCEFVDNGCKDVVDVGGGVV